MISWIIILHGGSGRTTTIMAQLHLQPPEQFNFKKPDNWPRWTRRFEQFRVASGLAGDDAAKQISTLLYCLGEEAEAVLTSTNPTDEERQSYDAVIAKFDGFFRVRKNTIFERARFNRRNQCEGESAEHYIMALYELAENCDYGDMKSEMIHGRLVVGIRDNALSERLQLDPDLDLEKAKKAVRKHEAVHEQQLTLKGATTPSSIEALQADRRGFGKRRNYRRSGSGNHKPASQKRDKGSTPNSGNTCSRCGKGSHPRDKCPAKEAICHRCQRKGHYGALCYSKTAAAVESSDLTSMETAFLDNMTSDPQETAWYTHIQLSDKETLFKLDIVHPGINVQNFERV